MAQKAEIIAKMNEPTVSTNTLNGAKWLAIANIAKIGLQAAGLFTLSRLLGPEEFGLMAMATVVSNLAGLFRDMGTGAAVVQRKNLTPEVLSAVYTFNIAVGAALCGIILASAPIIEDAFNARGLAEVLVAMSFVFPITSFGAVHQALLERRSNFKLLVALEVSSYLVGLAAAVAAATMNYGVHSLTVQALTNAALLTVSLIIASDWKAKLSADISQIRDVWAFSGPLTGYHLTTYVFKNIDQVIVGSLLGAQSLGIYSLAAKLTNYPQQLTTLAAGRALAPKMAQLQDDTEKLDEYVLKTSSFLMFVSGPIVAIMISVREPLILLFFGSQWSEVPPTLLFLLAASIFTTAGSPVISAYIACAKVGNLMKTGLVIGGIQTLLLSYGASLGTAAAAAAVMSSSILASCLLILGMRNFSNLTARRLFAAISRPLANSALAATLTHYALAGVMALLDNTSIAISIASLAGLSSYALAAKYCDRSNLNTLSRLVTARAQK